MSQPNNPSSSDARTRATRSGKAQASKTDLEISPVSIKQGIDKKSKGTQSKTGSTLRSGSARRRLDLSKVNLLNLPSGPRKVTNIGNAVLTAKPQLKVSPSGKLDVSIDCVLIRWPDDWTGFKFFLFADHTGCFSVGSSVETFSCLQEFVENIKSHVPSVSLSGCINYKWSSKAVESTEEIEVYYARKGLLNISITDTTSNPQPFCAFDTIRNIINMPYNSSVIFPNIFGDCILRQDHVEDKKRSFMIQDPTGYAVIHVTDWEFSEQQGSNEDEQDIFLPEYGPLLFRGRFQFEVVSIEDTVAVSATIQKNDVRIDVCTQGILTRQINLIKSTRKIEYMFQPEFEFDIRL